MILFRKHPKNLLPSSPFFSFLLLVLTRKNTNTSPCFLSLILGGHVKKERKKVKPGTSSPYFNLPKKKVSPFLCVTKHPQCFGSSESFVRFVPSPETLDDLHVLFAPDPEAATSAAERRRQLGLKMQGRERAMVCQVCFLKGQGTGCTPAPV